MLLPFEIGKLLEAFQPGILKGNVIEIKGLKCDNPLCNYEDPDIPFEEYIVGQPCPNCGSNLLTQEDYDTCKQAMEV